MGFIPQEEFANLRRVVIFIGLQSGAMQAVVCRIIIIITTLKALDRAPFLVSGDET